MVEALVAIPVVFFLGALLLLERRCLGQIAFVQPIVLCGLVGFATGNEETGIWIGVSLQLLSVGQGHYADWALAGFAGAASLWISTEVFSLPCAPGTPGSVALVGTAVASGIMARMVELRFARTDGVVVRSRPPWDEVNTARELETLAHRRVLRGGLHGGVESLVATSIATLAIWGSSFLGAPGTIQETITRLAVPSIGMAVALGSLAGYRFVGYAAAGLASVVAIMVLS